MVFYATNTVYDKIIEKYFGKTNEEAIKQIQSNKVSNAVYEGKLRIGIIVDLEWKKYVVPFTKIYKYDVVWQKKYNFETTIFEDVLHDNDDDDEDIVLTTNDTHSNSNNGCSEYFPISYEILRHVAYNNIK